MTTKVNFSKVRQDYYPLGGGLDLVSPAININPGKVIDAQNYEPAIQAGYRRIDGYERYDGRSSPTAANYWLLKVTIPGVATVGKTVTGNSSGATATVLAITSDSLVLGRLSGSFSINESLTFSP